MAAPSAVDLVDALDSPEASDPALPVSPSVLQPFPLPALLVNRRSFRASRTEQTDRAIQMARDTGIKVFEADHPQAWNAALDQLAEHPPSCLMVIAGDGTVHALAELMAQRPAEQRLPLMLLGGGRTNLIAEDLGGAGRILRRLRGLRRLIEDGGSLKVEPRHPLVIEQPGAPARQGYFLAGAYVDDAIRECHRFRKTAGSRARQGVLSNALSLLKQAALALIGRHPARPPQLRITSDTLGTIEGPTRLLAISTLHHRRGLLDPYAARGAGVLRFTAVTAPRFWWRMPRILCGRFSAAMDLPRGYLSGRGWSLSIQGLSRYTLDGEEYDCDPAQPVTIRVGPATRFVLA